MINVVTALLHWLVRAVGLRPYTLEIEPGTVIKFWAPCDAVSKHKPVVVLLHGFCGDGIINWHCQVGALTRDYAVYVPDLLFFGGSVTDKAERSPEFQAECLATGLGKLGVEKCVLVGFSYGGFVALKMVEMYAEMVQGVVLPVSVEELKTLLSVASHLNLSLPNRFYADFLQVSFYSCKPHQFLRISLHLSCFRIN